MLFNRFFISKMFIFTPVFSLLLNFGIATAETDIISDTENCLYCHRYPAIGRYDEKGRKRIFYVNDTKFVMSVHGKLSCKNCHVGLDKIPHTNVKKVNCTTKCHIKEPSTEREFSHSNMVKKYEASVHGQNTEGKPKRFAEDLPTCEDCHQNRILDPPTGLWGQSEALSHETLTRCKGCHTKDQWAESFYLHFTHRMRRIRNQTEIVKLCTGCHENQEKMARHGLETVDTYKDTYHWTQVKYGVKNAPDCISCHVPVGYSTHDIRPRTDPASSIHILNRVKTCSNQGGVQSCHPGATAEFASGRVHAYGMKAQMISGKKFFDLKAQEQSLVLKRAKTDMPKEEVFHYNILKFIEIFYKVFIAAVISFMLFHQWLDYLKIIRKPKKFQQ